MDQVLAVPGGDGRELGVRGDLGRELDLEALQLLGDGHDEKEVEGEAMAGSHLLGAVAQGCGEVKKNVLESALPESHCRLLKLRELEGQYGGGIYTPQWHDGGTYGT